MKSLLTGRFPLAELLNAPAPADPVTPPSNVTARGVAASEIVPARTKRGVPNVRWLSRARLESETIPQGDTVIAKVE